MRILLTVLVVAVTAWPALLGGQGAAPARPPQAPAWFVNVAAPAGLSFVHTNGASASRHLHEIMSGGGLFLDYDNDGWLDVFLVDGGSLTDPATAARARHRLFRNKGNGTFEDVSAASGIAHRGYGMGACAADYDNDGFTDLYVTALGGNALYHNERGASFADVTKAAGVGAASFPSSCAFGDVDRDGDVDLFVVNYVDARLDNNVFCGNAAKQVRDYCHPLNFKPLSNTLFRNNGNGTFADVSRDSGVGALRGNGLGVVIGDYDDDGWPDIFVANDTTPNFLLRNTGKGTFTDAALMAGVSVASDGKPRAGMGTDFGDVDGDGDLDLFVTNHELETHTLFRNMGKGLFSEATAEAGLTQADAALRGVRHRLLRLRQRRRPGHRHGQRPRDQQPRTGPARCPGGAAEAALRQRRPGTHARDRRPGRAGIRGRAHRPDARHRRHRQRRRSRSAGHEQRRRRARCCATSSGLAPTPSP